VSAVAPEQRELFVRHARKEGRSVAILRAIEDGQTCRVDAEVFPASNPAHPTVTSYRFADVRTATSFVTEAVEALMYLGCDVQAG
jgi:hypothetical protein